MLEKKQFKHVFQQSRYIWDYLAKRANLECSAIHIMPQNLKLRKHVHPNQKNSQVPGY